jgi:hypothetical protein
LRKLSSEKNSFCKTLLLKPSKQQKLNLELLTDCNTPPIKNGYQKLSEENLSKKLLLNKKRKRSQSNSDSENNYNDNTFTIFDMKKGNNCGSEQIKRNKFYKSPRKDSNIYDINNFVVQNFSSKIVPKNEICKILTPIFQELPEDFYIKNSKKKAFESENVKGEKTNFEKNNKENYSDSNANCHLERKTLQRKEIDEVQSKFEKDNNLSHESIVKIYFCIL